MAVGTPPARAAFSLLARLALPAALLTALLSAGPIRARPEPTGGAPIGGLAPAHRAHRRLPRAPAKTAPGKWLKGVTITEYWPAPESWFVGLPVSAPGLPGEHRIDWLYSAIGISMEGEGIGLDGRLYHIASLGQGGWVTASGRPTAASTGWAGGAPYWRAGGLWRNASGEVTFPLALGGWSAGTGQTYVPLRGVMFAPGPALALGYYQSIAVDPGTIPLGSRVYIPAYQRDGHGGWFIARDTGGAIDGRHVDVFRPPPSSATDAGRFLTDQRVLVIRPKQ